MDGATGKETTLGSTQISSKTLVEEDMIKTEEASQMEGEDSFIEEEAESIISPTVINTTMMRDMYTMTDITIIINRVLFF